MKKYFFYLILLSSCGNQINKSRNEPDEIFLNWNKATFNSINQQTDSSLDEYQKSMYINRLRAFKSYLDITNFSELNKNSIRYKLLKQHLNQWSNNFYLIEANESGEQIRIISYIIFPSNNNTSEVIKYMYHDNNWEKVNEYKIDDFFNYNKENYITLFGKGKNDNDITVTHFQDGKIISSDFYLFATMKQIKEL